MEAIKAELERKRKAKQEEFQGKKYVKRGEIEALRLAKLREEEAAEAAKKARLSGALSSHSHLDRCISTPRSHQHDLWVFCDASRQSMCSFLDSFRSCIYFLSVDAGKGHRGAAGGVYRRAIPLS